MRPGIPLHCAQVRSRTRAGPISSRCCLVLSSSWGRIRYYIRVKRFLWFPLALLMVLAGCYGGSRPTRIGSAAPDFTIKDDVRSVSLHDLKGKVVLLNFWATWCPPCVEEMPSLVALQTKMKDKVTVLAISVDVDEGAYKKFLKDHGVDLLTVR